MARIKILYRDNYKKPILIALTIIKEFGGISLEQMAMLKMQYNSKSDIEVEVPSDSVRDIAEHLSSMEFGYEVVQ